MSVSAGSRGSACKCYRFISYDEPEISKIDEALTCLDGIAISPCHDSDLKLDGEKKKPHWHWLIKFATKAGLSKARKIGSSLGAANDFVEPCELMPTISYFTHETQASRSKASYSRDDVLAFGTCVSDVARCYARLDSSSSKSQPELDPFEILWALVLSGHAYSVCDLVNICISNGMDLELKYLVRNAISLDKIINVYVSRLDSCSIEQTEAFQTGKMLASNSLLCELDKYVNDGRLVLE